MARREYLLLFFLVMTFSVCNSLWMDHRDRHMPPPVVSFLEKIGDLSKQRLMRHERNANNFVIEEPKDNEKPEIVQDNNQNMQSNLLHSREKRYAPSINARGCHLGTCQIQNLANMLYRLGKNSYKDDSNKDTTDPLGYGKRRRRSLIYSKDRTDSPQILQAT